VSKLLNVVGDPSDRRVSPPFLPAIASGLAQAYRQGQIIMDDMITNNIDPDVLDFLAGSVSQRLMVIVMYVGTIISTSMGSAVDPGNTHWR
jgi:hypothetical protein